MKSFPKMISFRPIATAYYPTASDSGNAENVMEGGPVDCHGNPLNTLQDAVEGKASYVSVAIDQGVLQNLLPYGTLLHIPILSRFYGKQLEFRIVDTGGHFHGKGLTAIDICVRDRQASFDSMVNRPLDVVALVVDEECRKHLEKV